MFEKEEGESKSISPQQGLLELSKDHNIRSALVITCDKDGLLEMYGNLKLANLAMAIELIREVHIVPAIKKQMGGLSNIISDEREMH